MASFGVRVKEAAIRTVSKPQGASVELLEREMFSEAAAARLLRLPQSTLHYWLEGGTRRGREYRPVVRIEPRGERSVTWAEFIEAALLRQYRRAHGVPMRELRSVIDRLREQLNVMYPLAHAQPYVGEGRRLLLEAQEDAKLSPDYCLVAIASGQIVLTPPSEAFVSRVEWSDDIPVAWKPHSDPGSPVRMTPDVRFGLPSVGGIKTEVIWEHLEADEAVAEVAEQFGLKLSDVRWAYAYETSLRAA